MTIGISVDGASIAAYACNGTDDEAWFFGNQTDGKIDIKSRFRTPCRAEFDGNDVAGDLTMNGVAYKFTAAPVSGAAGMYTADFGRRARIVGGASRRQRDRRAVQPGITGRNSSSPSCSSSPTTSSGPGAQHAQAPAGPADHKAAERLVQLDHQRPRRDARLWSTAPSGCHNAFSAQRPSPRRCQRSHRLGRRALAPLLVSWAHAQPGERKVSDLLGVGCFRISRR